MALAPQHVRIFFLNNWFNGGADPISKGDPRTAESFIRTCRLAQTAGATINLTNWYGPWKDPEKQMADFAATLQRLVRDEKLSAIRYVTVQNEVNDSDDKVPMPVYDRLYLALDENLKKLGLREQIHIVAGDLVSTNQREWMTHIGEKLAALSDGYSIHAYWDKLQRRLRESREMLDALPREQQRPLFVTEFGVRGKRPQPRIEPGTDDAGVPIADTPQQAAQLAWFNLDALNRGYAGTVIWTMEDAWYDRLMPYGVLGAAKDNWPTKPGYHVLRLLTHTTQPGWRTLKIEGESDHLTLAACGVANHLTLFVLNHTTNPTTTTLAGLPANTTPHLITWNADGHATLKRGEPLKINSAGQMRLPLCPLMLVTLTTESFDP